MVKAEVVHSLSLTSFWLDAASRLTSLLNVRYAKTVHPSPPAVTLPDVFVVVQLSNRVGSDQTHLLIIFSCLAHQPYLISNPDHWHSNQSHSFKSNKRLLE